MQSAIQADQLQGWLSRSLNELAHSLVAAKACSAEVSGEELE